MSIPLYYDIALVAFLLIFFFVFYKKGFVSSFIGIFGLVISVFAGNYLSILAAKKIYDLLIKDRLILYVTEQIGKIQSGVEKTLNMGLLGKLFGTFMQDHSLDTDASELASTFIKHSLEGGCINMVRILVFLIVVVVAMLLLKLLSGLLEGVNDLPLVGFPNQLLGGALGLVIGLLIMFILCSLISLILNIWQSPWMNKEVIESSFLFSRLFVLNPFYS